MVGKPVVRGTRLTVEYLLRQLAHGVSPADLLAEYPGLTGEDVLACLLFASRSLEDLSYVPQVAEAR